MSFNERETVGVEKILPGIFGRTLYDKKDDFTDKKRNANEDCVENKISSIQFFEDAGGDENFLVDLKNAERHDKG